MIRRSTYRLLYSRRFPVFTVLNERTALAFNISLPFTYFSTFTIFTSLSLRMADFTVLPFRGGLPFSRLHIPRPETLLRRRRRGLREWAESIFIYNCNSQCGIVHFIRRQPPWGFGIPYLSGRRRRGARERARQSMLLRRYLSTVAISCADYPVLSLRQLPRAPVFPRELSGRPYLLRRNRPDAR